MACATVRPVCAKCGFTKLRNNYAAVLNKRAVADKEAQVQESQAQQLAMIQGALNRMLKRQMSMAWEKWQQVYADAKFANRAGGGAIRRMLNRKLSMAWEKWQFTAAEMARQQFMVQGALNRMLKRQMSMAWEKWQQVYADAKFANRAGGGAIRRMLNRKLSMAWENWQKYSASLMQQVGVLHRAVASMLKRLLTAAWNTWRGFVAELKSQLTLVRKGLMLMMNFKLAAAFGTLKGAREASRKDELDTRRSGLSAATPLGLLLVTKGILRQADRRFMASCLQMMRLNFSAEACSLLFQYTDRLEAAELEDCNVSILRAMFVFEVFAWLHVAEPQSWDWSSVLDSFQKVVLLEEILRSHHQSDLELAEANSGISFLKHFMNHTYGSNELSLAVDTFTFEMENSLFAFDSKKMVLLKDTISNARCKSDARMLVSFIEDRDE